MSAATAASPRLPPMPLWRKVQVWGFWAMGWLAMLGAITWVEWERHKERVDGSTQGTVIRQVWIRELHGQKIEPRLRPVVGFSAPDGAAVEFIAWRTLTPGETVAVRYDRQNPAVASVPGNWVENYSLPVALGLCGVMMVIGSAWLRRPRLTDLEP
jgi:hypothetical protein